MASYLKGMKFKRIIGFTGYSIISPITLYQSTIIPMAETEVAKSTLNRPVNKSELALIKNIKMACSVLASESNNPRNIAAKFGNIIKSSEKYNLEVKPFNRDLNLIDIFVSDQPPHTAGRISFKLKSPKKISIASLQQSFGTSYVGVPKVAYRGIRFYIDSSTSAAAKCHVSIRYSWRPKDIALAQIYAVSVRFLNIK